MGEVLDVVPDPSTLFTVKPSTPPKQLAEMIARALLEVAEVTLSTVGPEGVSRATKASIAAREILARHGSTMVPIPYWGTVDGNRSLPDGTKEQISAIFFKCIRLPWLHGLPVSSIPQPYEGTT